VKDGITIVLAVLVVGILLRAFVIGAVRVAGTSMERTLLPGDFVLVSRLTAFLPGSPSIGDVVAVRLPETNDSEPGDHDQTVVVKRYIAAPGDTILVRGRSVWVNRQELRLPSTARSSHTTGELPEQDDRGVRPVYVPKAGSFLTLTPQNFLQWKQLIENEGHRAEISSEFQILVDGAVTESYRVERDYCFLLGDNMIASTDSRSWGVVPRQAVIGRVVLVYWSRDPDEEKTSAGSWFAGVRWNRIGGLVL
jgi:signal peptidase I